MTASDASRTGRRFYFRGSPANEVETADNNPIPSASGEPYTLALLILWKENPGTEGIFRSGSSSNGNWLWMTSSGRLWGRHANVDSPASGSGPTIAAGWHTLVRVWDGQQVRAVRRWPVHQRGAGHRHRTLVDLPLGLAVLQQRSARRSTRRMCRSSARSALPGTTPCMLERESSRDALAGDGCGVRRVGRWRQSAGRCEAAGGRRCWWLTRRAPGPSSTYAFDDTAGGTLVFDSANWVPVPRQVEVSGWVEGQPAADQVILRQVATRISAGSGLDREPRVTSSRCYRAGDFDIRKNEVSVGTMSFAAGDKVATFSAGSGVALG